MNNLQEEINFWKKNLNEWGEGESPMADKPDNTHEEDFSDDGCQESDCNSFNQIILDNLKIVVASTFSVKRPYMEFAFIEGNRGHVLLMFPTIKTRQTEHLETKKYTRIFTFEFIQEECDGSTTTINVWNAASHTDEELKEEFSDLYKVIINPGNAQRFGHQPEYTTWRDKNAMSYTGIKTDHHFDIIVTNMFRTYLEYPA